MRARICAISERIASACWLIDQLEQHDPRASLCDRNIRSLIMFVEEINHALHAALQFKNGTREIGFAVVATEVRKLADRSQSSSRRRP